MPKILVNKSGKLYGSIGVSGSKNAVLPLMAATLLTSEQCTITSVPVLRDTCVMAELLRCFGADVEFDKSKGTITVISGQINDNIADKTLANKMRASIVTMGPILARRKRAVFPLPGGCNIGARPIDLHLKGFEALGANIEYGEEDDGTCIVVATADELIGDVIYLDSPSVGATENIIMAAVYAKGTTVLQNAAQEPEIVDLAMFLNKLGAKVNGAGTDTIRIEGVDELQGAIHEVIPDRIEAATYMLLAATTGGDLHITRMIPEHVKAITAKIRETGVEIDEMDDSVRVYAEEINGKNRKSTNIRTLPYPGFPTDAQPQFMAYLVAVRGKSRFLETVFENRYMHTDELNKMGANIVHQGREARVLGVSELLGAQVRATDLRAGAALIIAGSIANGTTYVDDIYHIERGYDDIVSKLQKIGMDIKLSDDKLPK